MKISLRMAATAALAWALVGCSWEGSDQVNSWDSANDWVNFSGTYYGTGDHLVSDYSTASLGSSDEEDSGTSYTDTGTAPAGQTVITGSLSQTPVVPGSVTMVFSGGSSGTFTDNGGGGLSGTFNFVGPDPAVNTGSGTINYDTGAWTLTLDPPGLPTGADITTTYLYSSSSGSSSSEESSEGSGATGTEILSLVVQHEGSYVKLIDNNGATYEGVVEDPVFSSDEAPGTGGGGTGETTEESDPMAEIFAEFSATGTSAAGYAVTIVGTFQGYYNTSEFRVENRLLSGTWIEEGGRTGNVSGEALAAAKPETAAGGGTATE